MSFAKGKKDESRRRIIEGAARRFRQTGVAGTGLTTIMTDAGLTNGGFYGHFDSKEHLVREAVVSAVEKQIVGWSSLLQTGGLEVAIRTYLDPAHRDDMAAGCASAALLSDIARQPSETRAAYAQQLSTAIALVADYVGQTDEAHARSRAVAINALLIGTLQLARATPDDELSIEILQSGIEAALALSRDDARPTG